MRLLLLPILLTLVPNINAAAIVVVGHTHTHARVHRLKRKKPNVYQAYVKLNYHEVANELDLKISSQIVKELAVRYKALSEEQRQVYLDEAIIAMNETAEEERQGKKQKTVEKEVGTLHGSSSSS